MKRGFDQLDERGIIPTRATKGSAGYDFFVVEDVTIPPKSKILLPTYVRAYMQEDEFLALYIRSSLALKYELLLLNQTGIIDSDYYNNPSNLGHIQLALYNQSTQEISLKRFDRVAQGIFMPYLKVDNDEVTHPRQGGFGSTKQS
ncbi:MAG: dUTP diphosphatase [Bacilli bacterium]|nr:dUTP diphosphatase [Bacilli bacterium]